MRTREVQKGVEIMKRLFEKIETKNLILRRFRNTDYESFYDYRNDPEIRRYTGEGWCDCTLEKAKKFIEEQTTADPGKPKQWFQIAIELKSTGELIGDLGIYTWDPNENHTQLFITIAPPFQQGGFAQEALEAALDYVFKILDVEQVIAITDIRNRAAINLLENLEFESHGDFKTSEEIEGGVKTEHLYMIDKKAWL